MHLTLDLRTQPYRKCVAIRSRQFTENAALYQGPGGNLLRKSGSTVRVTSGGGEHFSRPAHGRGLCCGVRAFIERRISFRNTIRGGEIIKACSISDDVVEEGACRARHLAAEGRRLVRHGGPRKGVTGSMPFYC